MYATEQDIIDRYGLNDFLVVADHDQDGVADAEVVDQALMDATAEIDTWLAAKYDLPLATKPSVLVRICADIAMYRLSDETALASELRQTRYKEAIRLLKAIAAGEASLGLPNPPPSANGRAHLVSSTPRRFTRRSMRGLK
ncbi:gp436 family protein [Alloalcanivorax xenomutans]|uniref:DUF1320 domain-containing protein n=1 Tax=Alloalcanivorax xenomutans TaxID=1094342 RepID=A0A9Q3W8Z4_9GAMM|nr:DUF1320 domain-containing protein [Alloalcanivorax xenomutans]MCE7510263.1 DUF1320 domain-containing protein [Alloalcanivorax xenomutans]